MSDPDLSNEDAGPDADASDVQANQYVTFSVAGEMFAVPMGPVQEIIRMPEVAQLPLAPAVLDGLANLRGRVLPIINLRRLFGCPAQANDDATRAVVIQIGQPLGFVVDHVASVLNVEAGELEPASAIQSVVATDYLTGVIKRARADGGHDLMMVLDFERLVSAHFSQLDRLRHDDGRAASANQAGLGQADALLDEEQGSDELRLVSFSVAGQEYGIDIADVQEIVQVPERISALPNVPSHVLGLISLRQRLLPLVSLRGLFGLPDLDRSESHRIVVIALPGGAQVGLVTDSVKEVLSVPASQADAMPGILAQDERMQEFSSICRLEGGKRLLSIISTTRLLGLSGMKAALTAIENMAQASSQAMPDPAARTEENTMQAARTGTDDAATTDDTDDDTQVVIFRLANEEFGVPIMSVQEIVRVPESLTRVPKTPHFVEGVINLRGTVLPVIDQRTRLGMDAIERHDGQRIMVYLLGGVRTGFIVDSVAEVLRIPKGQIAPSPEMSDEQMRLIRQVAKLDGDRRLVMLIDPTQLLQGSELRDIGQAMAKQTAQATNVVAKAA